MKDYAHIMCHSSEIIAEKTAKDIMATADRIQICTIIDDSKKKNGEYRVQTGSATFIAYSEANYYKKGEQVRVSIIGGDETKKKFIIGRYSGIDEQKPLTYVSPLDQILDITGNLAPATAAHPNGVTANSKRTSVKIFSITDSENSDFKLSSIYDSISLSADFKTFLVNSSLASGDYGLRLEVFFTENKKENYYLSVADMFGNPYSFSIPTKQSKVFSIDKENKNITRVDAYLYQDKNFIDFNGASLPVLKDSSGLEVPNIIVSNVRLGLGDDLLTIEDKTINLYTENSLNYVYDESNTTDNVKHLKLLWYNKNDQNAYIGFSDGIYDPDYDELEYLEISDIVNGRLRFKGLENIPYDKTSLDLANHREIIYTTLEKAINIYEGDYLPLLVSLMRKVGLSPETDEDINTLQNYGESWTVDKENINMVYTNLLTNVYNIQQDKLKVPPQKTQDVDLSTEAEILNNWPLSNKDLIDELITAAMIADKLINEININNSQNKNLKNDQVRLIDYWNKIYSLILNLPNDENTLKEYLKITYDNYNLSDYPEYNGEELEVYDGKYCIYLYRYDSSYVDYINDKIFASPGWERLVKNNSQTNWANELLPDKLGETTYQPRDTSKFVEQTMRYDKKEEKFMAIIVFNHQIFRSQELVFTNIDADKIIDKNILATLSDKLIIEHEENSRNDYFLYNFSGDIVNYKDSRLDRKLSCHFNSIDISDVTGAFQNATIRWYVPNTNTNLTCDEEELTERGFSHIVDSSKIGYDCYQKTIKVKEPEAGESWSYIENGIDGRDFWYQIKDYYFETYFNNTIICEVRIPGRETTITGEVSFTFGFLGSSGTGYTLVAGVDGPFLSNKNEVTIVWHITDKDGNIVIPDSDSAGKAEKIYGAETIKLKTTTDGKGIFTTVCERSAPSTGLGDVCVVELSCPIINQDNGVILTRKIPIGAAHVSQGIYYEYCGLTQIIYDSYGSLANRGLYTTNQIELYYNNQPVQNITCSITYPEAPSEDAFLKQQVKIKDKTFLDPATLYLADGFFPVVEVKGPTNALLYKQPLVVYQNAYQSTVLNSWDGSFTIDEDSGTVLSTMLGAGRKNTNNKFDGVLLGDVKSGTDSSLVKGIGLYGFNEGVQSFGFNIDGTAFIGKANGGRILFDGNESTITSQGFVTNNRGIKFDLDQPYLHIQAKSGVSSASLFQIKHDDKTLINISDSSYYLQNKDGTFKINLNNGLIEAKKLKIDAWDNSTGGFWLNTEVNDDEILFKVGDKGNFIQLKKSADPVYNGTASLSIEATNFNLSVGRKSTGGWVDFGKDGGRYMILNSNPPKGWYYFKMGNGSGSDITFHEDGRFSIKVNQFTLSAGGGDNFIYLSNNTRNFAGTGIGVLFQLGQSFGVTPSGRVYATDAILSGSVKSGSGLDCGNCGFINDTSSDYLLTSLANNSIKSMIRFYAGSSQSGETLSYSNKISNLNSLTINSTYTANHSFLTQIKDAKDLQNPRISIQAIYTCTSAAHSEYVQFNTQGDDFGLEDIEFNCSSEDSNISSNQLKNIKTTLQESGKFLFPRATTIKVTLKTTIPTELISINSYQKEETEYIYENMKFKLLNGIEVKKSSGIALTASFRCQNQVTYFYTISTGGGVANAPFKILDDGSTYLSFAKVSDKLYFTSSGYLWGDAKGVVQGEGYWNFKNGVTGSQRSIKKDIISLNSQYLTFFDNLKPSSYRYIDDSDQLIRTGFIVDEVEDAMTKAGFNINDNNYAIIPKINEKRPGINYTEFIPIIIYKLQELDKEKKELKKQLNELLNR